MLRIEEVGAPVLGVLGRRPETLHAIARVVQICEDTEEG